MRGALPACQDLTLTDGSKTAGPASTDNADWTELSESTYRGIILNGDTGAKALRLPFVSSGEPPIELIRRPPAGEDAASLLGSSRLYNQAQIRVFLSDNLAELPGGTGLQLANVGDYMMFGILYGATDTAFAEDQGSGAPLIDGFLLVQGRQSDGTYADVTLEWLNLGIARENTNTAILKFQSLLDDSPLDGVADIPATAANLRVPTNFYPFNLYDSREGEVRDVSGPTTCALGGIMNIVELDVDNLRKWLAGLIGTTGNQVESVSQNGYLLYFSDRRGMLPPNLVDPIVGEYGYEDLINPTDAAAMPNPADVPNGLLDPAEDVNQNGIFDTYGADNLGDGFGVGNGDPTLRVGCIADVPGLQARINRVSGARHALKLANGTTTALPSGLPTPGFTVGSENPVYVQGDYNANGAFGDPHVPAAIIADSVTFLSNNWEDWRSFANPTDPSQRAATATWFRVAVATGRTSPGPILPGLPISTTGWTEAFGI